MLIQLVILTLVALVSPQIVPGIKVRGFGSALGVAVLFALLNLLLGWLIYPLLAIVSLPLACLTLGLFNLLLPTLVNTLLLKVVDVFMESFELKSWWSALALGFLFALGSWLARSLGT